MPCKVAAMAMLRRCGNSWRICSSLVDDKCRFGLGVARTDGPAGKVEAVTHAKHDLATRLPNRVLFLERLATPSPRAASSRVLRQACSASARPPPSWRRSRALLGHPAVDRQHRRLI